MTRTDPSAGFTLLEVMVAMAILGLALTAILSAQAGLYSANVQARNLTQATAAARCKMNELEETLLREGIPFLDKKDEGECCNGESPTGMRCFWTIDVVVFPNLPTGGSLGGGDAGTGGRDGGTPTGGIGGLLDLSTSALSGQGPAGLLGSPGNVSDLARSITDVTSPSTGSPLAGITGMALTMVYPQLKPVLEASIRRVRLEVRWDEGNRPRTLELVQFVTQPQRGNPMLAGSASALPGSSTGLPGMPTGLTGLLPGGGLGGLGR